MNKVLVIGIDGVSYTRITENLNDLPFFEELHKNYCLNKLTSVIPPITSVAWSCSYTGKNPGRCGMYNMVKVNPQTYNSEPCSAADRCSRDIYEIVSDFNGKVIVLGMPYTFPPRKVNGILISEAVKAGSYPESITKKLIKKYGYELLSHQATNPEYVRSAIERRFHMAEEIFKEYEWDLGMLGFEHLEIVNHNIFITNPEGLDFLYRSFDVMLRNFLSNFENDVTVILYSDHGHRVYGRRFYVSRWLKKKEFLKLKKEKEIKLSQKEYEKKLLRRLKESSRNIFEYLFKLTLYGIKNIILKHFPNLKYPVFLKKFSIFTQVTMLYKDKPIEYGKSVAFSAEGSPGNYGAIYINLKDKFKNGVVESGNQYNKVRDRIISELRKEDIILEVWKKEEIVWGNFLEDCPDVYFRCKEDYNAISTLKNIERGNIIENLMVPSHEIDGFFGAKGNNIKNYNEKNMSILDSMPTILYSMGLPVPKGLDGEVKKEIFTKDFTDNNPIVFQDIETDISKDEVRGAYSAEKQQVRERLRGLGYID